MQQLGDMRQMQMKYEDATEVMGLERAEEMELEGVVALEYAVEKMEEKVQKIPAKKASLMNQAKLVEILVELARKLD